MLDWKSSLTVAVTIVVAFAIFNCDASSETVSRGAGEYC